MSTLTIDDKEITRELWQSRLPICFILSDEDITKTNRSELLEPLYLMLSRHLYFPCIIEKIFRYYSTFYKDNLTDSTNNISLNNLWLEYENIPLKWHYPIGVLYDLYTSSLSTITSTSHLPWQIIVHLSKFPENELIRFPDKESIEAHYMSTLKEADALKHKGQIISDMQKRDHKQLWNSLLQDRYEGFWNINIKLMSYTDNLQYFRYIPFRIYILDKNFIQKLFSPYDIEHDKWMTLNDLIQFSLNHEAQCEQLSNEKKILNINMNDYRVIIHGVQPPLHTPIQWLSEYFSYPDNFLHICLIEKRT
jgi:autophagy-related protein 5